MCEYKYKKLRARIVELFDTQKAFAEHLGLSENSVSLKLNGKTGFDQKDMSEWAKALNITQEEYLVYFFS